MPLCLNAFDLRRSTALSSYETVLKRWPVIITGIIDVLHQRCHVMSLECKELGEGADSASPHTKSKIEELQKKIKEATQVIEKISKLKYEMARDRPLEYAALTAVCS